MPYLIIAKPVHSHEVTFCRTEEALLKHIQELFEESPIALWGDFLQGEYAGVILLPSSEEHLDY